MSENLKVKKFIPHLKKYIFRGILASIPIFLSFLVIQFLYLSIDKKVVNIIEHFIGFRIPGLGFILVLIILYIIGYLTTHFIGKSFFNFIEKIASRIPLIKSIYQIGKQISTTISLPEKQVFKQVVLVDVFKPGALSIGFVTGTIINTTTNEKIFKVFLPTVPNPTSGILILFKESDITPVSWSVEEAMKIILSGGIIGPDHIEKK